MSLDNVSFVFRLVITSYLNCLTFLSKKVQCHIFHSYFATLSISLDYELNRLFVLK